MGVNVFVSMIKCYKLSMSKINQIELYLNRSRILVFCALSKDVLHGMIH